MNSRHGTDTLSALPHSIGQTKHNVRPYSRSEGIDSNIFVARAAKSNADGYRKRKRNDLWPLSNLPHRTGT